VDPRAGLDDLEKRKFLTLPGLELQTLDRPARRQSQCRLRYPGSVFCEVRTESLNVFFDEDSEIGSWVPWDSEPRITVLVRASSNLAVTQSVVLQMVSLSN
jgi:hypothetical protein